ncbi:MAG: Lon protease family protein [Thermosulfidibacteraceae bacterium]|jgi:lon-related putative ATP-dependent protease
MEVIEKGYWECNPEEIKTYTSSDTERGLIELTKYAQKRAVKALEMGLEIKSDGFNVYVAGFEGTGRTKLVMDMVREKASLLPPPPDWCYVYNFMNPQSPKALKLPAGKGREFKDDMNQFIENIKNELHQAFESKEYEEKATSIIERAKEEKEELTRKLNRMAEMSGFALKFTPSGIIMIPIVDGRLIQEDRLLVDPILREQVERRKKEFEPLIRDYMTKIKEVDKKVAEELKKIKEEVALFVINHYIEDLISKYQNMPEVYNHINEVKNDIIKNLDLFLQIPIAIENPFIMLQIEKNLSKYQVNVIVDNSNLKHAPIVYETNPTYSNLFGRIALRAEFGVYVADFTQIVPGSIHRANGGFLILRIWDLLINPGVWHTLKKMLLHREITIQPFLEELGIPHPISTIIRPQPIPLDVKIILIGDPLIFHILGLVDPEFNRLFKVKAEFSTDIENSPEIRRIFAITLNNIAKKGNLKELDEYGMAKLFEYIIRLSENHNKLSLNIDGIMDVVKEASFYATKENSEKIRGEHIEKAIKEKIIRSNLIEEKIRELIKEGIITVDLEGSKVGQVYGLSVIDLGDYSFGRPTRITARAFLGDKGIINIEREVDLAGKIFSKASLILVGYLQGKYGRENPLGISATCAFEQSYSMVEGDSASVAELLAILSAIAEIPLRQDIAFTGSIDQMGNVQPVGGINEKVEGFYRVCKVLGKHATVVIPLRNRHNLQLMFEEREALKKGELRIIGIEHIDEAIEIATGMKATEFHSLIERKIAKIRKKMVKKKT